MLIQRTWGQRLHIVDAKYNAMYSTNYCVVSNLYHEAVSNVHIVLNIIFAHINNFIVLIITLNVLSNKHLTISNLTPEVRLPTMPR